MTALESLRGLSVIDEVQLHPELLPIRARFLILGSASPALRRQSSETLAGRIAIVEMAGFTLEELNIPDLNRLWLRGGFPRSFLARTEVASTAWREDFIRTFLERDWAHLGVQVPSGTMRSFWTMTAQYSGGNCNSSEIGRSLGEAHTPAPRGRWVEGGVRHRATSRSSAHGRSLLLADAGRSRARSAAIFLRGGILGLRSRGLMPRR